MREKNPKQIGKYEIIRLIGKGGMGEIFLASDPVFKREVALKRISDKLLCYPTIKKRFLSEAKIAAQLAHPSIIPIYALHEDADQIYYTMPYIKGDTLKHIIKITRDGEKSNAAPHPIGSSIPVLIRLFLNVCQAMHYAHTKGFLHRDLKSENIIVGKFGEVMILDWGIATRMGSVEEEIPFETASPHDLTRPGKVVGTVGYMAPERAMGCPATIKTDIYSLGVILYQLMTFRLPFIRPSLREFRKHMQLEQWVEPQEVTPHRDIPPQLAQIAKQCLKPNPEGRYASIHEVIEQLESYIEGCPEWVLADMLRLSKAEDWEFQENVMLAKRMAVSRFSNVMEWFMLMISKESYSGNVRIESSLKVEKASRGVGFLLCIPEPKERQGLEEGYCLWVGTKKYPAFTLFRSNVEVMHVPESGLEPHRDYKIAIEKVGNNLRLLIDGNLIFSYVSCVPLVGGHLGLLFRDAHFKMDTLTILFGSQNVMVNCLSIPDAFMTEKDYTKALAEYRRIAHSFKGRAEGREALFRAGITILEQAKSESGAYKQTLFALALDEFEKLRGTPGAPLEYLGKSLVYRTENDIEEEIKCLELSIRKYLKHPLLPLIGEHVGFRLHETSRKNRRGAYSFLLLALRHVPNVLQTKETEELIAHLVSEWEGLPFIEPLETQLGEKVGRMHLAIQLAFWLSKPTVLYELLQKIPCDIPETYLLVSNILFTLLEMGYPELVEYISIRELDTRQPEHLLLKSYLEMGIQAENRPIQECLGLFFSLAPHRLSSRENRVLRFLMEKGLNSKNVQMLLPFFKRLSRFDTLSIDLRPIKIWALLLAEENVGDLFPKERIETNSPYYPLYGCFLAREKGEKQALDYFELSLETPHPPSSALLSHFLQGAITLESPWMQNAFLWEKIQLFRQLALYYSCLNKRRKAGQFEQMIEKERKKCKVPLHFM